MSETKICFVIAPIGDSESDTRKRSDQVLKHIIRPAVEVSGYKAIRADEIDKPGIITTQVIQHVVDDPLVVADLTERNPNVFYELAVRHAIRKPLVQLIKKGEQIPFDVAGTRTIQVDHRDLDSVEAAKTEIVDQIRAQEGDAVELETPISVSLNVQVLRQSGKPEERSLADLVAAVSGVATSLSRVETRIGTQGEESVLDDIQRSLDRVRHRLDRDHVSFGKRPPFHPSIVRELGSALPEPDATRVSLLFLASSVRHLFPWLYDLTLDAFRKIEANEKKARQATEMLRILADLILRGPLSQMLGSRKELYWAIEEYQSIVYRIS